MIRIEVHDDHLSVVGPIPLRHLEPLKDLAEAFGFTQLSEHVAACESLRLVKPSVRYEAKTINATTISDCSDVPIACFGVDEGFGYRED